jgi:hypothetical protein
MEKRKYDTICVRDLRVQIASSPKKHTGCEARRILLHHSKRTHCFEKVQKDDLSSTSEILSKQHERVSILHHLTTSKRAGCARFGKTTRAFRKELRQSLFALAAEI